MEEYYSPNVYAMEFIRKMRQSRIDEKRQAEQNKINKAEAAKLQRIGVKS